MSEPVVVVCADVVSIDLLAAVIKHAHTGKVVVGKELAVGEARELTMQCWGVRWGIETRRRGLKVHKHKPCQMDRTRVCESQLPHPIAHLVWLV